MTRALLERRLRYWQKRLKLQEWDIKLHVVPPHASDSDAHSDIDEYHARVVVTLVDPEHLHKAAVAYRDPEFLLVHELLHVRLEPSGVKEDTKEHVAQERGINAIAAALLAGED